LATLAHPGLSPGAANPFRLGRSPGFARRRVRLVGRLDDLRRPAADLVEVAENPVAVHLEGGGDLGR